MLSQRMNFIDKVQNCSSYRSTKGELGNSLKTKKFYKSSFRILYFFQRICPLIVPINVFAAFLEK